MCHEQFGFDTSPLQSTREQTNKSIKVVTWNDKDEGCQQRSDVYQDRLYFLK